MIWVLGRRVRIYLERVAKELPEGHLTGLRVTLGKFPRLRAEPDRDGGALVAESLGHKTSVAQRLRAAGYFSWGPDAWIHVDDEGTVLDTEWALSTITDASNQEREP